MQYLKQSQNDRMISVHFQGKPFNITVIQICAPTTNPEEAEAEWFYEDLQDLPELTPKKDVLFIIGDWNAKVGSQETPGVTLVVKCCTQGASQTGKLSSGHRTGKGQVSFQFQRKAMPKNAQTTAQLHSSHMLAQHSPSQASTVREPRTSRCTSWI